MHQLLSSICRYFLLVYLLFSPFWLFSDVIRTFEYNKNNQLIKEQKANGHAITYEYDPCGRLIRETASDGVMVQYAYDKNGNCTQMTDSHGTTMYLYDPLNQLVAVQFPNIHPISYHYDVRGRLTEIAYPNGWTVLYEYDSSNRLVSVTDRSGITKYVYDDATNTLVKTILPNGIFTEYQYDRIKRITDVTHKRSDEAVITSYHYCFDANGNRTQVKETSPFGTKNTTYTYDKLSRLLSVENTEWFERYTYDGIGNRLSKETPDGVILYEYDQSNHLIKAGDTYFLYDPCGNLIKKVSPKGIVEFTYDAHDNLIQFRRDQQTVKYGYDGAGRRISKNVNGIVTHYINDVHSPVWQVALQTTATDEIRALYTYGLSRITEFLPTGANYYLYDYPDRNVVALVNRDQKVINRYEYSSFGSLLQKVVDVPNDFSYAGEAFEEESQLIYLRNRYYDPELGRFVSPDPEFGSKMNPQSLNPYTYVNNNPLNYIDPAGLRSAKACAYVAGTKTSHGKSLVGHGFWELTYDNGTVKTIGKYSDETKEDFDAIVPGTVYYEWPATDAQIDQIISSVKSETYFLTSRNCVNGLEKGLDVLGVEHPSFKFCGVSIPTKAVFWLESLSGRSDHYDAYQKQQQFAADPDRYMATLGSKPQPPAAARSSGNVGGVSLNKTAQLLGKIADVQGATYDGTTGQLIMIGKKNAVSLPEMDFDDLAVAVRSIYGLGGQPPQNPGVSLDLDPKHPVDFKKIIDKGKKPHPMLVRYVGQTKDTRFGQIMFEADRILKCLSLGKDNKNGKKMHANVPGFKSLPERYSQNRVKMDNLQTRLWFVPKEMSIYKNRKGNSIVFKDAKMQVLTETTFKDKKKKKTNNSEAEKFAEHFTQNYSKFAKQYPVLKELERLGKITAIVKWMKENKIPLDLSLFKKYKPAHHSTPKNTPAVTTAFKDRKNTFTTTIVGGVIYSLDDSNFHEVVQDEINPLSAAAMQARPSENVFSWTFQSPIDSSEMTAVAQTVERTVKVGNVRKACVDMRFGTSGDYPLELVRYYNSFNDDDIGFGRGWDVVCTRLRFPRPKVYVTWKDEPAPIAVYPEIFAEEEGRESRYVLAGLRADKKPLYESEEEQAILVETNQGYALSKFGGKLQAFSYDGKILSKSRNNQMQLSYHYNNEGNIAEILHAKGSKITFTYDHGRIVRTSGPSEKWIKYDYDAQGQLHHVSDSLGTVERYGYDANKNLNSTHNCRNELLFEAVYDEYNRAVSETVFGKKRLKSFDLKTHALHTENIGQGTFHSQYDSSYRLLQASDSENRLVRIAYDEGKTRPKSVTDCLGNEKQYVYDGRGNVIRIIDPLGAGERFWYNDSNQLFAYQNGEGKAELYVYNEQGLLSKVYHFAQLISDDVENGKVSFKHFQKYVTEYGYDSASGLLLWIKQGEDLMKSFSYTQDGMLAAVQSPAGYTLQQSYDARGRLSRIWDSGDQGSGFEYQYDDRDRLIRVSSQDGMIEYRYNDTENQNSVQDACGGITEYSFDAFGNLLKIQDPLGGVTSYEYDENYNLKRIRLPNGSLHEIDYDGTFRPKADIW